MITTTTPTDSTVSRAPLDGQPDDTTSGARGHIGRIVTLTMLGGLLSAVIAVAGPFAGAEEHVITASLLGSFAIGWGLLAHLTTRWTGQLQRWAFVPAVAMGVAAATILIAAPTGNELGWVWPPALVALVGWMVFRSRRQLRSRTRVLVLYPVFAALALSAIGGAYETYRETKDPTLSAISGYLIDIGDHRLHINCTGSGSPTVVLEAGLGEVSPMMASWLAPDVAPTTRVCVYDRAGRGWSESAPGPQDGEQVASDLHRLLHNAGVFPPYVLAGHSAGGIYVLNFARLYPNDVAGVALLDSMHPQQYDRMASWPGFYEMYRRASAVMPTLARVGIGRAVYGTAFGDLPEPQRDQERDVLATPRHNRSVRDEFHMIRTAMNQAAELHTLGDIPLAVVTANRGHDSDWAPMQDDLATLSSNSVHRYLPDATHQMVVEDGDAARQASQAIVDVVSAVRTNTPINVGDQ
jgi:pimeloyl-ACP methyl ester carboxylesterase